jgi:hypothetical protein
MYKQAFFFSLFCKLTLGRCKMFRLADAEVPGIGLTASTTHWHMSSGSPSTCLLYLRDQSHSLQARRASRLTASSSNETPHGAPRACLRSCIGILMMRSGGWCKQLRAIPGKLIQRYSSLSLKGAAPKPRFRLIPGARDPPTWVLISVLPDSVEEGRTGQLGTKNVCMVASRCRSG